MESAPRRSQVSHSTNPVQVNGLPAAQKPWDDHRAETATVARLYGGEGEFQRKADRLGGCSPWLRFAETFDPASGICHYRLREALFCRVRTCPVCTWRRTMTWRARLHTAIPTLLEEHPKARWIFLTLTIRNCAIERLGAELKAMSAGWNRLLVRKELGPITGWLRTTEVTRGKGGEAHPHYHVLCQVMPSYFKGQAYVSLTRWVALWRSVMRLEYNPICDARAVKKGDRADLEAAIAEVAKYSVKGCDLARDRAWLFEYTRQVHKRRFVAAGGTLKALVREQSAAERQLEIDLAAPREPELEPGKRIGYEWETKRYRRAPRQDRHRTEAEVERDYQRGIEAEGQTRIKGT